LGIVKSAKTKSVAKPVQPAKRKRNDTEEEAPRRQSARLRKTLPDPNETRTQRKKREVQYVRSYFTCLLNLEQAEEEVLRIKREEERLEAEERAREAKRARHEDLLLNKLVEHGPEDLSTLNTTFKTVVNRPHTRRVRDFDAFVYESDKDKQEEHEIRELRKRLGSLRVVARAKVNQNRIYSAAYHPEVSKDLVFFGGMVVALVEKQLSCSKYLPDKHGELGIWDARAPPDEITDEDDEVEIDNREGGRYWRLQLHWPATSKSSISNIKFNPVNAHSVSHLFS
jgi:hypothetical protein